MRKTEEKITAYEDNVPNRVVKRTTEHYDEDDESPRAYKRKKVIYKSYQVIWYLLGVLETLLFFRIFLKIIGANISSPFTQFVYAISYPFAAPFFGVVGSYTAGGFVFEWSTVLAMMVYGVLAYALVYLLQLVKPTSSEEVEEGVEET